MGIVLGDHPAVVADHPPVGVGHGHGLGHRQDGPIGLRDRQVAHGREPRRQLGHRAGASRDDCGREQVLDVLERPVQLGSDLPVVQGHTIGRTARVLA